MVAASSTYLCAHLSSFNCGFSWRTAVFSTDESNLYSSRYRIVVETWIQKNFLPNDPIFKIFLRFVNTVLKIYKTVPIQKQIGVTEGFCTYIQQRDYNVPGFGHFLPGLVPMLPILYPWPVKWQVAQKSPWSVDSLPLKRKKVSLKS